MIIFDSSCWLEYFAGSDASIPFSDLIQKVDEIIVPTIVLQEVFRKLITLYPEKEALFAIAQMEEGFIAEHTRGIALEAARYSSLYKLPLADSIIYATAMQFNATIYTLDHHFEGLPNVKYFEKRKKNE
ncbi:MAG: (PilT terminus) domain [Ignavibacteria bacterium]|nr:(PilT terminus) domain [Ignavibacteria bacterium]